MAWTDLTFGYGTILTSTQMTQLDANLDALAAGASGAPIIKTFHRGALCFQESAVNPPKLIDVNTWTTVMFDGGKSYDTSGTKIWVNSPAFRDRLYVPDSISFLQLTAQVELVNVGLRGIRLTLDGGSNWLGRSALYVDNGGQVLQVVSPVLKSPGSGGHYFSVEVWNGGLAASETLASFRSTWFQLSVISEETETRY